MSGYQGKWDLSDFLSNGAALRKHPLLPTNLESFLVASLDAEIPRMMLASNTVCLLCVLTVQTYVKHVYVIGYRVFLAEMPRPAVRHGFSSSVSSGSHSRITCLPQSTVARRRVDKSGRQRE